MRRNLVASFSAVLLLTCLLGGAAMAESGSVSGVKPLDLYQKFISKLAENLGIEQSKLEEAIKASKQELIDEEVQNGVITQEQAERMTASHNFNFLKPGPRGSKGMQGIIREGMASVLGISQEQLKSELESGKKLEEVASSCGLTMEQLREKLAAYEKEKIARDLENGTINQEQADRMLERIEKRKASDIPAREYKRHR